MPYPSIDSDEIDADDIITCISSDDDGDFTRADIAHDHNDLEPEEMDDDNSGELIEVVDDVEFVEETDALDVNGDENSSSVFAFEMF